MYVKRDLMNVQRCSCVTVWLMVSWCVTIKSEYELFCGSSLYGENDGNCIIYRRASLQCIPSLRYVNECVTEGKQHKGDMKRCITAGGGGGSMRVCLLRKAWNVQQLQSRNPLLREPGQLTTYFHHVELLTRMDLMNHLNLKAGSPLTPATQPRFMSRTSALTLSLSPQ